MAASPAKMMSVRTCNERAFRFRVWRRAAI